MSYKKLISLFALGSLPLSQTLFAADIPKLYETFKYAFYHQYTEGNCGSNVDEWIKKAKKLRIDLSGALLIQANGYGDLRVYHARSFNLKNPPSQRTWFHHYFLIAPLSGRPSTDRLRSYYVFDFDFGNKPIAIKFSSYLEWMFLSRHIRSNPEKINTDFELGLLKFTAVDVESYLNSLNEPDKIRRSELLKKSIQFKDVKFRDLYQEYL